MSSELRTDLPTGMPSGIRALPVHRGYPVPWFVADADPPDFRIVDARKLVKAVKERRCWICGKKLSAGWPFAFVIGPMCAVNRISSEPPSHVACAAWSTAACPFLSRPHMKRRNDGLPEDAETFGVMIERNPGVTVLWETRSFKLVNPPNGGVLFQVGDPLKVTVFAEGRHATPAEVAHSLETGLPVLMEMAKEEGEFAVRVLNRQYEKAKQVFGLSTDGGGG